MADTVVYPWTVVVHLLNTPLVKNINTIELNIGHWMIYKPEFVGQNCLEPSTFSTVVSSGCFIACTLATPLQQILQFFRASLQVGVIMYFKYY